MFGRRLRRLERQLEESTQVLLDRIGQHEIQERRDILNMADQRNAFEAAEFVAEHLSMARPFKTPRETLLYALGLAPLGGGMALEFGVYQGGSLAQIAQHRFGLVLGRVYGFDSFEGLPEDWRAGFEEGAFATEPPEVPGAEIIPGWFEDTLPAFLETHSGSVDFLHIDCDLYSSTKTVLDLVGPRLKPGSVIVFDEFFNYTGWREHEFKAWGEFVLSNRVAFEWRAFTYRSEQVVVQITG